MQAAIAPEGESPPGHFTYDDELLALADSIPGFGGLYEAKAGVVLVLTDSTTHSEAGSRLSRGLLRSMGDLKGLRGRPVLIAQGRFTFRQLVDWRKAFETAAPRGLVYVDADERRNTLSIGVPSPRMRQQVAALIRQLGIPEAAVFIEVLAHPVPMRSGFTVDSLKGVVRPPIAGVMLTQYFNTSGFGCTLGANVVLGRLAFVTNSHCTSRMLGLDPTGTTWSQPMAFDYIEVAEFKDPPVFSGGKCPAGRVCRYSDAALVEYLDTSLWGGAWIAYPAPNVPPAYPYWSRVQVDQTLTNYSSDVLLTGSTSGLLTGTIVQACARFDPDSAAWQAQGVTIPGNLTLLCQSRTDYLSGAGDSGGPVWSPQPLCPLCPVYLRGIHHSGFGTDVWYSPVGGIKLDLGNIKWDMF